MIFDVDVVIINNYPKNNELRVACYVDREKKKWIIKITKKTRFINKSEKMKTYISDRAIVRIKGFCWKYNNHGENIKARSIIFPKKKKKTNK